MSKNHILITGGAGFIGSKLASALISLGVEVTILDNFSSQVHTSDQLPEVLSKHVKLIRGDVRNRNDLIAALAGVDTIVHLAAETGTGQSMYEIDHYFDVNVGGTATLLDLLQNEGDRFKVQSIVIASSRAVYGEGAYLCQGDGIVYPTERTRSMMSTGLFEPICPKCGSELVAKVTSENAPFLPMSFYGLTKQIQEQAVLMYAKTKGINAFALRYQNVYGPGQSLKNPYTGILAVFSNLARQNAEINIYEDGLESRDFVYIDDVVEATVRSIFFEGSFIGAINVGSGIATKVIDVAKKVKDFFNSKSEITISGAFRIGDIRHNFADVDRMKKILSFTPLVEFDQGIQHFLGWARSQPIENNSLFIKSTNELRSRGLLGGIES